MWKGKPIGDGTPFEAERALKPCEFNSRSFRLFTGLRRKT